MEELSPIAGVRKRPGMYVGGVDGNGVLNLVLDVVPNAWDQYLVGICTRIELTIAADGTVTIEDDGPGMPANIDHVLTHLSTHPTVDGHRPHIGIGVLGLFVVNALSEYFELVSVRDGTELRATYAHGEVIEPIASTATTRSDGTRVRFRPDRQIFDHARAPRTELTRILEDLTFLAPKLRFRWSIEGDDIAAHGLAARVALELPCAVDEVAHVRESFETMSGPIAVEVALAWRASSNEQPTIHSFVNLGRDNGMHVDGMLDGVAKFLGNRSRAANARGLVAAVSVILADVKFGNPVRDRLDSPEAREPVSKATQKALAAWALAHPDDATTVRNR